MARVRSHDYDDKRDAIIDIAAEMFAERGYANVSIQEILETYGASKSIVYHYFKNKEEILFSIVEKYSNYVTDSLNAMIVQSLSPEDKLGRFIEFYIDKSDIVQRYHQVLVQDLRHLSLERREYVRQQSKNVVRLMAELIGEIEPSLSDDRHVRIAYANIVFSILNGTDVWYRKSKTMRAQELSARIASLFLSGVHRQDMVLPD